MDLHLLPQAATYITPKTYSFCLFHRGASRTGDLSPSYLRVKFNDGSSKNIEDYGKRGTEKLKIVYQFFEDLKHNQQWEKVQ